MPAALSPKREICPLHRLSSLARFIILYAALYCAFGVVSPFLPAYFGDRGLTSQEIAFGSEPARGFLALLHLRTFRRLLLVGALVLGSHALHDTFAVIGWRDAGIGTAAASLLWSEQVIAEVVVFLLVGPALLDRLGPANAAMLAAGAGVVRWSVLGVTTQIVPLALVEPLHGLTFALFHLAGMRLIGTTVPRNFAATAQALYGTAAIGSSIALLTLASGPLYAGLGGHAFWVMAILCAAAIPLARRMTG
jgi:PPP family 3-phenylpropionic acid transporter